jgi:hypothetical protein
MANTLRFKRGLASGIPTALAGEPLFTTDTFDLYIGNGTTNTRFQKYIASGATTQILRGDGSLYTFPLAISSPSNGQVLKYNGTSWVNDSDSGITGSLTTNYLPKATGATTLGNSLLQEGTNAIGLDITPSPWSSLLKGFQISGTAVLSGQPGAEAMRLGSNFYWNAGMKYQGNGSASTYDQSGGEHYWYTAPNNSSGAGATISFTGIMRLFTTGNLLIQSGGTFTDSGEKLQVTGTMKVTGASSFGGNMTLTSTSNYVFNIVNSGTSAASLNYTNASGAFYMGIDSSGGGAISGTTGYARLIWGQGAYPLLFATNNVERMRLDASGNLGLGVTPSAFGSSYKGLQVGNSLTLMGASSAAEIGSNNFYNGTSYLYITNTPATLYAMSSGQHGWYNAPSGTAGGNITFTQAMTLDASGNLGVGTASPSNRLHVYGTDGLSYVRWTSDVATTGTRIGYNGTEFRIDQQQNAAVTIRTNSTEALRVTPLQNLHIGTFSSDSGEKLQVNGTAKITGATYLGGQLTASTTIGGTSAIFQNTGAQNSNGIELRGGTGGTAVNWKIEKDNTVSSAFQITPSTTNGGTTYTTPVFTLASSGAATFSSSVTAASGIINGNLTVDTNTLFVDATNNRVGIGTTTPNTKLVISNGSTENIEIDSSFIQSFNRSSTAYATLPFYASSYIFNVGNVGIGMTPSYKLDVSGSARVSDAIAIGTTPDTNNPFKILKNINATVGIKFENTNTSSSAFSAVQLGTDVSGGTKFTNLVYASSGISASGVYNPDGTSLINNGNGGLNFLGNPIRMYTGGSNGVLRWDLVNDGYITHYSATSPTTSATDSYRQYSADVTAGNAAPHFRTENGAVIKLYQETTAVGNAIFNQGGGNAVLDDSTFAGYTLRQIVKALQNQGILA